MDFLPKDPAILVSRVKDDVGQDVSLSDYKGKVIVKCGINFSFIRSRNRKIGNSFRNLYNVCIK